MNLLAQRRRRYTIVTALAGLIGLVALPVLSLAAAQTLKNSKEGSNALANLPELIRIPPTPGALLGMLDDQGELVSVALLALAPPKEGIVKGGTVMVVPAHAAADLADGSRGRLSDAWTHGGLDEFTEVAEGLLGVSVTSTLVADQAALAGLLKPYAPVQAQLAEPVVSSDATGADVEVLPAGKSNLDASSMAAAFVAHRADQPELTRLGRVGDLWAALIARVGSGVGTPIVETTTPPPATDAPASSTAAASTGAVADPAADFPTFFAALFAGRVGIYRFTAVGLTDPGVDPSGQDTVGLNGAEIIWLTATVLPGSISPINQGIAFYVRSPLNDPGLTLRAVAKLLYAGANVVLVKEDTSIPIPDQNTLAVADPASDQTEAEQFLHQIEAPYQLVPADFRIDGVDAVLTLGKQWRQIAEAESSAAVAPTTEVPPATAP